MTAVVAVSLCEELPVNEALEIERRVTEPLQMHCALAIANRLMPQPVPEKLVAAFRDVEKADANHPAWQATDYLQKRWEMQEAQRKRLTQTFGERLCCIEEIDQPPGPELLKAVTRKLC